MALGLNWGKRRWRREGDRRRDAREWGPAAAAYRRHLARNPADAAIWVQLGHAEKEGGSAAAAEAAYARAVALIPEDADPLLHLGHALKLQGRFDEAFDAYRRSLRLDPKPDTAAELRRVRPKIGRLSVQVVGERAVVFSVQDFFFYFHHHNTMTGIQRVQAGIVLYALADPDLDAHFVISGEEGEGADSGFLLLDRAALRELIDYATGDWVDHGKLKTLLTDAELAAKPVRMGPGSTVVVLGAFWGLGNTMDRYLAAKEDGARLVAYIYDIIPITHTEYCEESLTNAFSMAIAELSQIVDHVFTISDYTRLVLADFLAEHGGRQIPMQTVPLAHSLGATTGSGKSWPAKLARVRGRRYVAYVSTVEGRKNHLYVVNAWRQLIEAGVEVPDLVFVGRHGWRINGLMELLQSTRNLDGRIHIVHGLSDAELNAVYEEAMFTVFTSFVEGWGLPVGESLTHGVPCVASRTSSIPEVGGAFVDYIDPYNLRDGVAVLRRMIEDGAYRSERRRQIVEEFKPRLWQDVGRDFVDKIKALEASDARPEPFAPRLAEGRVVRPADLALGQFTIDDYIASPSRLLLAHSFYGPEGHGMWMRGGHGRIGFQTGCTPGEDVIVYVQLYPAPGGPGQPISLSIDNRRGPPPVRRMVTLGHEAILLRARGQVADDGTVTALIDYEAEMPVRDSDPRSFALGLRALAWARASSVALREDIIEEFTFREVG